MTTQIAKLEDIANIDYGTRVVKSKVEGDEYPVYGGGGETFRINKYNRENCVVVSRFAMSPKCTRYVNEKIFLNDSGLTVSTKDNSLLLQEYLDWYLLSKNDEIYSLGRGAGQRNLEIPSFKRMLISYPTDLEEQRKIISQLKLANEIRAKKKLANDKLDELIDTKFIELFGNPEINPYNWTIKKLEDVTTKITDGVHSKPVYTNSGVPFISVKDITTKKLLFDDCKFISEDAHKEYCKRCKPEYLDVLYTKVGATYGRACVVDTTEEFSLYVSVALIKPQKDVINPFFLKAVLNTDCVKRQADKRIKGIGVPDLHLIEIKNFVIPVPPMEEQAKFIAFVEKVEAQKQKNEQVIEQMNNLFNSLSQRAFKGELLK